VRYARLPSLNAFRVVFLAGYLVALALFPGPGSTVSARLLAGVLLVAVLAPGVVRELPDPPRLRRSPPGR
jgi:hypothetical protein